MKNLRRGEAFAHEIKLIRVVAATSKPINMRSLANASPLLAANKKPLAIFREWLVSEAAM
jgi:hypothetical protein